MVVPEEVFFYSKCLPAGAILLSLQEEPRACGGFLHGIEEGSNIAFHFRVYTNSMVVMNSFQEGDGRRKRECFLTLSCQASHLSFDSWCWRMNTRCVGPPGGGAPWLCWACCGETHGESNSDVITTDQFFLCFVFLTHVLFEIEVSLIYLTM